MPTKPMQTWNAERQRQYRAAHPEQALIFHVLLDESPSMGKYAAYARRSYNHYLAWLQGTCAPMAMGHLVRFDKYVRAAPLTVLRAMQALTLETYTPERGDGTAMYDALGTLGTTQTEPGQHVLILLTDGEDCSSTAWTQPQCHTLLTTLQEASGWLCVFLAAFPEGRVVATALGFQPGNILVFPGDGLPEAFQRLKRATQTYLLAPARERKLLAMEGIFG